MDERKFEMVDGTPLPCKCGHGWRKHYQSLAGSCFGFNVNEPCFYSCRQFEQMDNLEFLEMKVQEKI